MDINNPFETKLAANKHMPDSWRTALVESVDTLDFCWAGVRAVFQERATPELAMSLLTEVLLRERQLRDDDRREHTDIDRP